MSNDEEITTEELNVIEQRCNAATPGPWVSYVEGRDHTSGESFILRGLKGNLEEDLYLTGATVADQDFIANARQDIPRLIREVKRLKSLLNAK